MKTVSEIIESVGGNTALATHLGLVPSGVSEMKRRESIPARHWRVILDLAEASGVSLTADDLVEAHANKETAK